jgi:hypothetical protein
MLGAAMVLGVTIAAGAAEPSVPYVPTPQEVVERMLEIAKVGPQDYLIDLGSGDGRIVVTAAKKLGARGFGVDLNPVRIKESTESAAKAGVSDRAAFQQRDLFETDLSDATVITMYLLPRVNLDLRPKLLELKPGTRLVSHDFSMDDWKAEWIGMGAPREFRSTATVLAGKDMGEYVQHHAVYLRKEFRLPGPVRRARAFVCGLGLHELRVNGLRVGDRVLEPAQTDYNALALYTTYDLTPYLSTRNAVGVVLGNGRQAQVTGRMGALWTG